MPEPSEAYRAGYEKGKTDNLGGSLAEITMGMLRDDPGGYYAAGYYDGAGGRKFNVHGSKDTKAGPRKPSAPSLPSPLESQWYRLCDESEFIPKETVDRCRAILHAAHSDVAAIIGLSAFTSHTCPRCGKSGHFRIHFLGRLKHPGACNWEGYMKTGSYISHQIAQVYHTGIRTAGAIDSQAKKKGESGNWMQNILGFLFVAICRALAAIFLIPLHAIVALSESKQTQSDIVVRSVVLVAYIAVAGICVYEVKQVSSQQFALSQPAGMASYLVITRCHACAWSNTWQNDILRPVARAGFHAVTGTLYSDGRIVQSAATDWTVPIIVGPFGSDAVAQTAMQRLIPILRPIAQANVTWNMPDYIAPGRADFAGYSIAIAK